MNNSLSNDGSNSNGSSSKLTPSKHRAVLAIVEHGSVARAAAECKLSRQTLYRWIREPEFELALREASSAQVVELSRRLTSLTLKAVEKLEKLLGSPSEHQARLAADSILTHAIRLRELTELTERIRDLELMMERKR